MKIYLKYVKKLSHLCVQFVEIMTSSLFYHKHVKMFQNLLRLFSLTFRLHISLEVVSFQPANKHILFGRASTFSSRIPTPTTS
jgi:hypothetical protein